VNYANVPTRYPLHILNSAVIAIDELEELEKETKQRKPKKQTRQRPSIRIKQQPILTPPTLSSSSLSPRTTKSRTATRKKRSPKQSSTKRKKIQMKKRSSTSTKSKSSQSTIRISNLLTHEEEIALTSSIRTLRSIIRIRDELSASITKNNPGTCSTSSGSYLPNPMYKDQHPSLPYKHQPTKQEWAQAVNLSILQLRCILLKGREARKRLVDGNVGLVTQIAKKYSQALERFTGSTNNIGCILTLSDLIQEGNLGLMEAAERFDGEKGFRFATYAVHWVRSRILRCIADHSRVIRLPAHGM